MIIAAGKCETAQARESAQEPSGLFRESADSKQPQEPSEHGFSQGFYDTRWGREMERHAPGSLLGSQQYGNRDNNMSSMSRDSTRWAQPSNQFVQDLEQFQKSVNNWKTSTTTVLTNASVN